MFNKKFKHKNTLFVFILRMLFGLVLFDEENILIKKSTQRFKFLPHYIERLLELIRLYPLSPRRFVNIIRRFGYPTSEEYKLNFNKVFTKVGKDDLFNSYKDQDDIYVLRLMSTYNRVDFIVPYIEFIRTKKVKTALDYGCGVSDIGILLSNMGVHVDLVDLDLPKLEFATERFKWRRLKVKSFPIHDTETVPNISNKYDLIIATEVIEHVRYPIRLINWFYDHLNNDGLLLLSIGRNFDRERGGDHLDEAFSEGRSPEYLKNFDEKFTEYQGQENLFIRKDT